MFTASLLATAWQWKQSQKYEQEDGSTNCSLFIQQKLLNNTIKWITDICNHVDESQKHYIDFEKPDTQKYILYDTTIYTKFKIKS